MASGAVRELITKIKFQLDKASESKVKNTMQGIKQQLNAFAKNTTQVKINADTAKATASIRSLKTQLNALSGKTVTTYVQTRPRGAGAAAVAKETTSGFGSGLAGVAGVIGGGVAISEIRDTADEMMNLDGRLRTVTKTEQERLDIESELYKRAQESRQSLQAMGDLYFKVARASQEMGFAQEDNLRVTETVSKALVIGGASAQEASATILQLGQALGSGRLQGDELRSLDENASILMGHVAGLKEMGAQGQLTSDEVMKAILSASGEIDKEFSQMPMTFGQSMNMMKNSWDRFILGVEQKSSIFSFIARAFTKAFDSMGNKLNDVLTLLGTPDANRMVTITEATTGEQKQISETDYYNQKAAENPALFKTIVGLKKLGEMFDNLDGKTGNLDEQIGGVIETLMQIGLVVVPLLAIIGTIDGIIALLSPFVSLFVSAGSSIMSALAPVLSAGLAPILAILAAIASVILFVGENWDLVVSWFTPALNSMLEGLESLKGAWEAIQPLIVALTPPIQFLATLIGGVIVWALSLMYRWWAFIFNQIAGLIEWIAGKLGGLGSIIQTLAGGLSGLIDKAAQFIGMKGQIQGVNTDLTQRIADAAIANGTTVNNSQTNYNTFTDPNQWGATNAGNGQFFAFGEYR